MARMSSLLAVWFVAICAADDKQHGIKDATPGDYYQRFMQQSATDYSKYTKSGLAASAESGNWKKYMDQYGRQAVGSQVGNFKQYTRQYAGGQGGSDNQQYPDKYAGDFFSGDLSKYMSMDQGGKGGKDFERGFSQYVDQGKKDEGYFVNDLSEYVDQGKRAVKGTEKELSKYVEKRSKWSSADASPSFLLEEASSKSARQTKASASGEAADYQKVEGDAATRAQHKIEKLRKLAAEVEAKMTSHPADLVSSIESEVRKEFGQERKRLQRNWVAKLNDLNATELAAAEWDEVERAYDVAADADDQLRSLDWEELKAMRHAYHERREAGKSHVRLLCHEARKASREAKDLGRHAEDRQQSMGVQERVYEHSWAQSEHNSERLTLEAQKAGEVAEAMVDKDFQQVEALLEKRLDVLKNSATDEQRARRLAEGKAKKAVTEARAAARRRSESQAASASPALFVELAEEDVATGHKAKSTQQSTEDKPAKENMAQQRYKEGLEQAEGVVLQLRQLARSAHENMDENAAATVSRIISGALEKAEEHRHQAEQEWKENLKALSARSLAQATRGELHEALETARHSQDELRALDQKQLEDEREAYDHVRREEDEEARKLDAKARRAIGRLDELGRHLRGRDAQDKAGRRGEQLQREADASTRRAEEGLDEKFRLVEGLLSQLMSEQEEAVRKEQSGRNDSRRRAEEAIHVARRAARAAADEAQNQPVSSVAAFLARPDDAKPLSVELLAGATLCLGAVALAGVVHKFSARRVRLNEQLLLG